MFRRFGILLTLGAGLTAALAGGFSTPRVEAQEASAATDGVRTVLDGVYTEEQALRGEVPYVQTCTECHDEIASFPVLYGDDFIDNWREDRLETMYAYNKATMPLNEPDTLGEAAYVDLMAYLLWLNDFPYGSEELKREDMENIQLVGRDGPAPLPDLALIKVVGCLAPGTEPEWALTESGRPARIRSALGEVTPEELEAAGAVPLGVREFVLQGVGSILPGFDPGSWVGHKVQVKGVLRRRSGRELLNTLSLESVASSCP